MNKLFLLLGSISGALSVAIGAFGAHGLKKMLEEAGRMETFETGVKYQFYHTIALILIGFLMEKFPAPQMGWAGWCFVGGILVFSGSLYALCLTGVTKLGAITPIGGLMFIAGWVLLAMGVMKG